MAKRRRLDPLSHEELLHLRAERAAGLAESFQHGRLVSLRKPWIGFRAGSNGVVVWERVGGRDVPHVAFVNGYKTYLSWELVEHLEPRELVADPIAYLREHHDGSFCRPKKNAQD